MESVLDGQPIQSLQKKTLCRPKGITLTTQQVRVSDPEKGIIEYHMDEFKEGMLLNSQPALIVISKK